MTFKLVLNGRGIVHLAGIFYLALISFSPLPFKYYDFELTARFLLSNLYIFQVLPARYSMKKGVKISPYGSHGVISNHVRSIKTKLIV